MPSPTSYVQVRHPQHALSDQDTGIQSGMLNFGLYVGRIANVEITETKRADNAFETHCY